MKPVRVMALLVAAAAALVLSACGAPATPAGPALNPEAEKYASLVGDAARGATAYGQTCSACHGPEALGIDGLGKTLVASEFAIGLPDAELMLFLATGRPSSDPLNTTGVDMPPKGGNPALDDQGLADIVAYLRTLEK
ncbi:MAG: cytochrome c [Anaerolineales bacterium]|nr:cytochrome c [Anaerolineales bacterium]